jgi:hypothetical protein
MHDLYLGNEVDAKALTQDTAREVLRILEGEMDEVEQAETRFPIVVGR